MSSAASPFDVGPPPALDTSVGFGFGGGGDGGAGDAGGDAGDEEEALDDTYAPRELTRDEEAERLSEIRRRRRWERVSGGMEARSEHLAAAGTAPATTGTSSGAVLVSAGLGRDIAHRGAVAPVIPGRAAATLISKAYAAADGRTDGGKAHSGPRAFAAYKPRGIQCARIALRIDGSVLVAGISFAGGRLALTDAPAALGMPNASALAFAAGGDLLVALDVIDSTIDFYNLVTRRFNSANHAVAGAGSSTHQEPIVVHDPHDPTPTFTVGTRNNNLQVVSFKAPLGIDPIGQLGGAGGAGADDDGASMAVLLPQGSDFGGGGGGLGPASAPPGLKRAFSHSYGIEGEDAEEGGDDDDDEMGV